MPKCGANVAKLGVPEIPTMKKLRTLEIQKERIIHGSNAVVSQTKSNKITGIILPRSLLKTPNLSGSKNKPIVS